MAGNRPRLKVHMRRWGHDICSQRWSQEDRSKSCPNRAVPPPVRHLMSMFLDATRSRTQLQSKRSRTPSTVRWPFVWARSAALQDTFLYWHPRIISILCSIQDHSTKGCRRWNWSIPGRPLLAEGSGKCLCRTDPPEPHSMGSQFLVRLLFKEDSISSLHWNNAGTCRADIRQIQGCGGRTWRSRRVPYSKLQVPQRWPSNMEYISCIITHGAGPISVWYIEIRWNISICWWGRRVIRTGYVAGIVRIRAQCWIGRVAP